MFVEWPWGIRRDGGTSLSHRHEFYLGSAGLRLSLVAPPDKVLVYDNFIPSIPFSVSACCNVYATCTCYNDLCHNRSL